MASVDVLHEGVLYLSRNPTGTKDWSQRLFVLKYHKETNAAKLEYYKDKKKRWQKQDPVGIIDFWPSVQLSLAHECNYKFPLKLVTNGQAYYLSASSFPEMNTWYHRIQLTQILEKPGKGFYEYEVKTKPSDSMKLIEANGACLLGLTANNELVCASLPQRKILGVWPYTCLRGYWCKESVFGFEAGRRAPRGEGIFEFFSAQNEELYRNLEKCILQVRQGDTRPPMPPPRESRDSDTPPVSTSSSDNDERYPIPKRVPQKAASVRGPPTTAPNLRRVHTHTGGGPKWLHEACDPNSPSAGKRSVSPLSNEDTYSHTVHTYNPQRHSYPVDPSGQTYMRLHGHEAPQNIRQPSPTLNNLPEGVYDVAYPTGTAPIIPSNEQYASIGMPDPSRVVRQQTTFKTEGATSAAIAPQVPIHPPEAIPVGGPSLIPVPTEVDMSDDQLTLNPMYGSRENILMAIEKLEGVPNLPSWDGGLDVTDLGLNDLKLSPAYEHHSPGPEQTPSQSTTAQEQDDVKDTNDSRNGREAPKDGEDPKSSGETPKSTRPYAEVKKPAARNDSRDETPPPLPARLYSIESDESDPPNNAREHNDHVFMEDPKNGNEAPKESEDTKPNEEPPQEHTAVR